MPRIRMRALSGSPGRGTRGGRELAEIRPPRYTNRVENYRIPRLTGTPCPGNGPKTGLLIGTIDMPSVRVKENEPFEFTLRRFRRSCEKAGVFSEMRRREFYEKPTSIRKRKAAAAKKRELKKVARVVQRTTRLY